MKHILIAISLMLPGGAAFAADPATAEQLAQIDAVLAEMTCEVDHDNVEVDGDTFDLDDVICADGQYDIKLDAEFKVTDRRKE